MSPAVSAPTPSTTYVIGHKNPDADSICSALAYAAFKEARSSLFCNVQLFEFKDFFSLRSKSTVVLKYFRFRLE